jgi:hypothetical protein
MGGQLEVMRWNGGIFAHSLSWAASTLTGVTQGIDCILFQLRSAVDGVFDQWQLDHGVVRSFTRWRKSTVAGSADAVDQVLRIEHAGGKIVKHVFQQGLVVSSQVVDSLGNVISDLGKDFGGALGGLFKPISHWHW